MEPFEFLIHRVAFAGVPFGELWPAQHQVRRGRSWQATLLGCARRLRRLAASWEGDERAASAAVTWGQAAAAYHGASFAFHLDPRAPGCPTTLWRLRRAARHCYGRALERLGIAWALEVEIDAGPVRLHGYLRRPVGAPHGAVVLCNGLDSMSEVEMHRFGDFWLARGLAVLALDLPAGEVARHRQPLLEAERAAPGVAEFLERRVVPRGAPLGAFGVSFGGHLVARLLAGDDRFRAGVAVSPPAWIDDAVLALPRVHTMMKLAFGLETNREVEEQARRVRLGGLPPPAGRLRVLQMGEDRLFGSEHGEALAAWAPEAVSLRHYPGAEHVGTSHMHRWLPEAGDWMSETLGRREEWSVCA